MLRLTPILHHTFLFHFSSLPYFNLLLIHHLSIIFLILFVNLPRIIYVHCSEIWKEA
jgi:hypothetical protein